MAESNLDIGMVGLGVMGRNLLLNMADHGYSVGGLDTDAAKVKSLLAEAAGKKAGATTDAKEFVAMLRKPRAIMMLVPAGKPVDAVIREMMPLLSPGDLLIDAGNSHFNDTDLRNKALAEKSFHFFGMGVSGGESGARHGPSMMPGGPKEAYERVRPILEAVSAKVNNEPCVAYLGPGSAGHYVKMVHNGIEYGLMQLISETYDVMKRVMGLSNEELHGVYDGWNRGDLNGFLMEITADIFRQKDDKSNKLLIDVILDVARQKGTGQWTSQDALELKVPVPTIDAAVAMRDLSGREEIRAAANKLFQGPQIVSRPERVMIDKIRNAFHAAMILTYAQGMAQLQAASKAYNYGLNMELIARIWRGGCIIRAALLEDIRTAYRAKPDLPELTLDPAIGKKVAERAADLRAFVKLAVDNGIPAAGHMMCLTYFDAYRSGWMPFNLIQAQRDYFGAHTYERVDEKGTFHTHWS